MENIYRFKKRMVHPEKLSLEQIGWSKGPFEKYNKIHPDQETSFSQLEHAEDAKSSNSQFIQDRIRHLVEAFSSRTQTTRERIEAPATPSSVSSRDSINSNPTLRLSLTSDTSPSESNFRIFLISLQHVLDTKIVDPNGKFYIVWMAIAAVSVMYNMFVIPLRSTFPYQTPENRSIWMSFDYIADFIYLIDMLLIQPRIKYLFEGFWVTDMAQLRLNYIKKRNFKFDLISLLPLDLLYFVTGPECVILRFPRFLKLHTFREFFSFIDKLLANPYIIRITRTLMYMMYLIHLNACGYYAFSKWEGMGQNNTFVYDGRNNAYIKCFYFATKTATSIGKNPKPTKEIEFIFMTCSWLMGVFVFAVLIGQIRDIISTATRNKTEYRKLVDETLQYMRRLNLPQDVQKRVKMWFQYNWETHRTLDENRIMDCLPHKMKTDIAINVHINTLNKVKLFADCDEALRRELVLQLKSVIYLPSDIICRKGDVGKEMYIIQSGKVQVLGRSEDEVLATLTEGSVFGEISLLGIPGMNRRTADVRSFGHSNLFVLSKADLNAALLHYPEAQELLNKKAKALMKKNAALEGKDEAVIIIENPEPKQAKLADAVLQVLQPDSKTSELLRLGSRRRMKKKDDGGGGGGGLKAVKSLPCIQTVDEIVCRNTFQGDVEVHRES